MLNKMKRVKFVVSMLKRVAEIDYSNPKVAYMQFDALERKYEVALNDGIINKEDYDSLIKAVEETKERISKNWIVWIKKHWQVIQPVSYYNKREGERKNVKSNN